jgi:hypothetical protein
LIVAVWQLVIIGIRTVRKQDYFITNISIATVAFVAAAVEPAEKVCAGSAGVTG